MKRGTKDFFKIFLVIGLSLISIYSSNAQDEKLSRKEIRQAEKLQNYQILDSLLTARSFVLEAIYLQNKYGIRVPVNSTINFIMVDDPEGVIQTGSDTRIGTNNVGWVTAEGSIGKWEVYKNPEKLRYTVSFNILTQLGNFDVLMTVDAENQVSATISGYTSGRLTWIGRMNTVENSRIFKGARTI